MSPTQRSLKFMRDDGYTAEVVEKWNPHTKTRKDLFGVADILAIKPGNTPILVQTTTMARLNDHIKTIHDLDIAEYLTNCGFLIELHGWRLLKKPRRAYYNKILLWNPQTSAFDIIHDKARERTVV